MKDDAVAPDDPSSAVERRLATILMADVFGYSRMMGEDEERTVRVFRGHRAVFDELLKVHRGRVFNTAGDAILAEFPSAVEAVRCATEIQAALRTRNEHLPEEQRMWFRIGINLGDVIIQGGDLLGDGVNVAARIQSIAEPGGVCISGSVYDQIQNKLTLQIKQLGEKSFKNIALPVRTFSISDDDAASPGRVRFRASRKGPMVVTGAVIAALIAVGGATYWLYRDYGLRTAEEARRVEEAQRNTEAQRKAELDRAAAAAAQKEAKLLAELQSTKDALTQAETTKRKAEQDRIAAEAAQREARIQSELKSAKEALQKAEQSEKNADEARKAANAAMETAAVAAKKAAEAERQAAATAAQNTARKAEADTKPATQLAAAKSVDQLDGTYIGRMCSINADGSTRCWGVGLTVQRGALSATWPTRFNNEPAHAKGTIAADGAIKFALDGYSPNGRVLSGSMNGRLADNKITVSGFWSNNSPINGTWLLSQ
jgi:class 3 adenylate cyclase